MDFDSFEVCFYRDLEKGFSADIACCDQCRSDFLSMWPYADHADDRDFDTTGIDLDTCYSGSYLRDQYTEAEFKEFTRQLRCPRCDRPLNSKIWLYNFPFDVPPDFERKIREINAIAESTPFLLLEHRFCREVLLSIRELSGVVQNSRIETSLFRGRRTEAFDLPQSVETFDSPSRNHVEEGRYNHAGHPVLYLASDKETCKAELRDAACLVLEFELLRPIMVLDLIDPFESHEAHADLLNSLVYSALVSAKQSDTGWHKPHYTVSRFVADCARASGFDAIKYPSTRRSGRNFNLVLVNSTIRLAADARIISYHQLNAAKT